MSSIRAIEVIFAILVLFTVTTQMVMPLWQGKRIFPIFRRRGHAAQKVLDAHEEVETVQSETEADRLKREANKLRGKKIEK